MCLYKNTLLRLPLRAATSPLPPLSHFVTAPLWQGSSWGGVEIPVFHTDRLPMVLTWLRVSHKSPKGTKANRQGWSEA